MAGATLTERQQQIVRDLVRLCQVSQHRSFRYTPNFGNRDSIEAKGTSEKANAGERDLRTLDAEGMVSLRWVRHGAADGTVTQLAFDAVRENFGLPPAFQVTAAMPVPVPAGVSTPVQARVLPARAAVQAAGDLPTVLSGLLADLTGVLRAALPIDEAEAAAADVAAITRQLGAARADADVVARRVRSLVLRIGAATGSASDLAARGAKLAEALQRLSSFVSLVAHWAAAQPGGDE